MNSKAITLLKKILKAKKLSLSLLIAIIAFVFSFNQVSSFNQSFTTFLAQ
ncbi:thermonuclease, partial [Campylobacter upsaliensis]|nr:thermonuclease [Campylobacter upsaliensis]